MLEHQIYNADHYPDPSVVLDLVGLRLTNRMLESVLYSTQVAGFDILLDTRVRAGG